MRPRDFRQVDVFTEQPYLGNPVAVVLDGEGLNDEQMLGFTRWTNLSEATFVLPPTQPGADYRVRIFCPAGELPFAGHPTLGTCHAWLEAAASRSPQSTADRDFVVQECQVGLVRIRRDGGRLAFAAPPLVRTGPLEPAELALIARGLGGAPDDIVAHSWCDNGPKWRGILLRSAEQVLALKPDGTILAGLFAGVAGPVNPGGKVGVAAPRAGDPDIAFEVRAFFPGNSGLAEDPVTGSLNAALGQWLIGSGLAPQSYVASQGTALGRAGRVHVSRDAQGQVWVGGASVTCVGGSVTL